MSLQPTVPPGVAPSRQNPLVAPPPHTVQPGVQPVVPVPQQGTFSNVLQPQAPVAAPRSTYATPVSHTSTIVTTAAPLNAAFNRSECIAGQHVWTKNYDAIGVCLAVVLFPIGLICCCTMYDLRCVKCNAVMPRRSGL